jgi:hypothetical protein
MSQRSTSNGTVNMPGPGWHDETWWPSDRVDNGGRRFHCPNRRPLLSQRWHQILPSHYSPFPKPIEDALPRWRQAFSDRAGETLLRSAWPAADRAHCQNHAAGPPAPPRSHRRHHIT